MQISEAVVRFPELASFLICVDDVKVSTPGVLCKPSCGWFQYHQMSFCDREALFINRFTSKKSMMANTCSGTVLNGKDFFSKNLTLVNINLQLNLGY